MTRAEWQSLRAGCRSCLPNTKESNVKFNIHASKDNIKCIVSFVYLLFFLCSYKPILEYIDAQFEKYLEEELKIKRSLFNYHDTRIHICLYFIAPTGHSLKSLDLVTMKKLDSKVTQEFGTLYFISCLFHSLPCHSLCFSTQVNIIPVIAKADTVSKSELDKLKIKIMSELVSNGVQIYQFPTEDGAVAEINSSMNVS